jgi:hypothetical protein
MERAGLALGEVAPSFRPLIEDVNRPRQDDVERRVPLVLREEHLAGGEGDPLSALRERMQLNVAQPWEEDGIVGIEEVLDPEQLLVHLSPVRKRPDCPRLRAAGVHSPRTESHVGDLVKGSADRTWC